MKIKENAKSFLKRLGINNYNVESKGVCSELWLRQSDIIEKYIKECIEEDNETIFVDKLLKKMK